MEDLALEEVSKRHERQVGVCVNGQASWSDQGRDIMTLKHKKQITCHQGNGNNAIMIISKRKARQ